MRGIRLFGLLALLALALGFPLLFSNPAITSIAVFALIFAVAATAWNIFSGYTGYISLGQATFYGIGSYTLALISQDWHVQGGFMPFLLLPLVGLTTGVFAIPLGWIALRTRHFTFVVITIAILFIFQLLAFNLESITNGSRGIFLPFPPWSGDVYNFPFYYVSLALLLLALFVSWWVRHSKYGLGLLAIRDDEDRVLGLGMKTRWYKLTAFVISAVFIGMAGAMHGYFLGFISPSFAFAPVLDVTFALMVYFGGTGTLVGPILGGLLLEPLQQFLTLQFGEKGLDLILFSGLLLFVILVLPEGVVPTVRRKWAAWMATRIITKSTEEVPPVPGTSDQGPPLLAKEGEG